MTTNNQYPTVGSVLKKAREGLGYDIHEIAEYLKIRSAYLVALENDDFKSIPGKVYVIGFLRTYAQFMNLDPDELIRSYKLEVKGHRPMPAFSIPEPVRAEQKPGQTLVYVSFLLVLLLFFAWRIVDRDEAPKLSEARQPEQVAEAISGVDEEREAKLLAALPSAIKEIAAASQGLCVPDSGGDCGQKSQEDCQTPLDAYYQRPSQPETAASTEN